MQKFNDMHTKADYTMAWHYHAITSLQMSQHMHACLKQKFNNNYCTSLSKWILTNSNLPPLSKKMTKIEYW